MQSANSMQISISVFCYFIFNITLIEQSTSTRCIKNSYGKRHL